MFKLYCNAFELAVVYFSHTIRLTDNWSDSAEIHVASPRSTHLSLRPPSEGDLPPPRRWLRVACNVHTQCTFIVVSCQFSGLRGAKTGRLYGNRPPHERVDLVTHWKCCNWLLSPLIPGLPPPLLRSYMMHLVFTPPISPLPYITILISP
jgi:hypothetical protein